MEQKDNIRPFSVPFVNVSHYLSSMPAAMDINTMKIINPSIVRYAEYIMGQLRQPREEALPLVANYAEGVGAHIKGTFINAAVPSFSNHIVNESLCQFSTFLSKELSINAEFSTMLLGNYVDGEGASIRGTFMDKSSITTDGRIEYQSTSGQKTAVKMEENFMSQGHIQLPGDSSCDRLNLLADVCHHVSEQQAIDRMESFWGPEQHTKDGYGPYIPFNPNSYATLLGIRLDVYQQTFRRQLDDQKPSDSAQQLEGAGMDWTADHAVSTEFEDDHQRPKSEETLFSDSSSVRGSSEEILKESSPASDLASPAHISLNDPSLFKLAEAFGKVGGIGLNKAHEILNHFSGNDEPNVPSTFVSKDQMAPQAASASPIPVRPKNLVEQMEKLNMQPETRDVDMDNADVQMGRSEEGQGEHAADEGAKASATQQLAVRQRRTQAGPATEPAMQDAPAEDASDEETSAPKFTAVNAPAKKATAKKPATMKASTQTPDDDSQPATPTAVKTHPAGSYKAQAGNIHFDVLITGKVIKAGDHILVPNRAGDMSARMEFVSYKKRVSSWKVYCEQLRIDGKSLEGTGPMQWGSRLELMGFDPPKGGSGFGAARVVVNGKDKGSVNELKSQHA